MKIIHLANHIQNVGNGIVNVLVDLACAQADAGHDVIVAAGAGGYKDLLESHGVRVVLLEQLPKPKMLPGMLLKFNKLVIEIKPDIVHAHMMTGVLIARGARMGRKYRIVGTVHNEFQRSANAMKLADIVVGVSVSVSDSMVRRGIPLYKMREVANGSIGTPRNTVKSAFEPITLQHPNVVTVAGMYFRKGIDTLIEAMTTLPKDAHLYLVGDGPDKDKFATQAVRQGLSDRVHFLGFRDDIPEILKQADVFCLASRKEPFGLAIVEARAAGCAIVASDVDGIPQALDGGAAGILATPGDAKDFSTALSSIICNPLVKQNYRDQASKNLGWLHVSRMANDYMSIYRAICNMDAKEMQPNKA